MDFCAASVMTKSIGYRARADVFCWDPMRLIPDDAKDRLARQIWEAKMKQNLPKDN